MNPELRGVWENIRELGLGAMQHALRLCLYSDPENPSWPALAVLSAAHAAELLIKARIAQEHPLLIFETMPKSAGAGLLDFARIAEDGRTFQFNDLPGRLWATTGTRIPNEKDYRSFGRLRNIVQHFARPDEDLSLRASTFIIKVVDPFIGDHWGLFAIDYNEEYGDHFEHIFEILVAQNLRPRISPTALESWRDHVIPETAPSGYRRWFQRAVATADRTSGRNANKRRG